MKKVLVIFGTRPEAIKMAPVIKALQHHPDEIKTLICVTAQHRQMLDQVLELFELQPDFDLDIMKSGQDLFDITCHVLQGLKLVLEEVRPDLVLVHGDTTTTMAAALAAFYCRVPVGHVEAGLRTHNKFAPFPEEINRTMAGALSDIHFAPTESARQNLLSGGFPDNAIIVTGNTVIDALYLALDKIRAGKLGDLISRRLKERYPSLQRVLSGTNPPHDPNPGTGRSRIILVTGHRRENFGSGFENICLALKEIAESHEDVEIIYPVHLNPNVQEPVHRILSGCSSVHLIEPQEYLPFIYLMSCAYFIITDSGGVQEEAPSLGKPVLVMRDTTERPEAVVAGTVRLVGTDTKRIVSEATKLLDDAKAYEAMSQSHNPYGDGRAAQRIFERIATYLNV